MGDSRPSTICSRNKSSQVSGGTDSNHSAPKRTDHNRISSVSAAVETGSWAWHTAEAQ